MTLNCRGVYPAPLNQTVFTVTQITEDSQMVTPAPDVEATRNHVFHSRQYMENALEALQKNEPGKAGELIWGSITQAVHAVDAWRGPVIGGHRGLLNFARNIGEEIDDENFPNNFLSAKSLHDNFYHPELEMRDVEVALPGIQRAISQVLALLPGEIRDNASSR